MKISNFQYLVGKKIYQEHIKDKGREAKKEEEVKTPSPSSPSKDDYVMSQEVRMLKELLQEADRQPEVREGKVQAIKARIQSKGYEVNTELLARVMLGLIDDI